MPVYPGARKLLIPPGANDPRITPRVAILHVDAGNAASLHTYFRDRSGGVESHFHVRRDGVVEQYRDTDYQADANHLANDFAVSIETQGYGAGEWTPEQLESIKALLDWLNRTHGIPLRKIDRWDGEGVGYHVLFGAPGPWTPVAKSCPGPDRIRQFDRVLVPWMAAHHSEEITVTPVDFLRYKLFGKKQGGRTVADVLREDNANLRKIAEDTAVIRALLEAGEQAPKA